MEKDQLEPAHAEEAETLAPEAVPNQEVAEGEDVEETITNSEPATEENVSSELERLREENQSLRNQVLRTRADFENARRRTEREKQDSIRFANKRIFFDLLGVMDNFERAVAACTETEDPFVEGVLMIQKQLEDVLTQNGVKEVPALNHPFDPYNHEAFAKETHPEVPENTVIEVFQKGYKFFDQLLRPATVKVSTLTDADD